MTTVRVYNTTQSPAIIDDGRTLGGGEWHEVEATDAVYALIGSGVLYRKPEKVEDSPVQETVLESEPVDNNDETSGDDADESLVEDPVDAPPPATISKSRRSRKPSSDKE